MTLFEERFLETITLKTTGKPIYLQFIVNRTRGKPSTWNGFRLKVVNRRSTLCSTCVQALVFGFRLVALLAIASLATAYENWKHCPNHWWRASVVLFLRHTVISSITFFYTFLSWQKASVWLLPPSGFEPSPVQLTGYARWQSNLSL